ncbi:SRPBCC family protein [Peribacillus glennii]|uniref:SRPBCC domain-containing protein n=1 Tax=Peribacillus glennii TaxID=2303991 RepID=A0A372LA52_9BACI|nr:SRPBCC domain-containing protein [Peribacillus glennii]RFU62447.1 SRPBCC domain-containing protein [Peribacillus glennii]
MPVQDIQKTTVFHAPIHKVWEAVATAEGIAAWFMPNDFEQELGHEFTIQSPFGPTPCKVLELEPPNRLVFSWGDFGWVVSFNLKEVNGETEFTMIHSGWGEPDEVIPQSQQKHSVVRGIMDNGWGPLVNDKLRKVVEG